MADVAQLLQTLHPMREPPPPAPVMPYLAALALGAGVAALAFFALSRARRQSRALRRSTEAALAASRRLQPPERLAAQAQLLRRFVLAARGGADARLDGAAWLAALDRTFATTFFTQGDGRVFGDALYRRGSDSGVDALDIALSRMVRRARVARARS